MTKPSVGLHESLVAGPQVHARAFDDEVVILDLAGGEYYALNAVGARIWEQLSAGTPAAAVAGTLVADYQVDAEQATRDCLTLADELVTRGLLQRRR